MSLKALFAAMEILSQEDAVRESAAGQVHAAPGCPSAPQRLRKGETLTKAWETWLANASAADLKQAIELDTLPLKSGKGGAANHSNAAAIFRHATKLDAVTIDAMVEKLSLTSTEKALLEIPSPIETNEHTARAMAEWFGGVQIGDETAGCAKLYVHLTQTGYINAGDKAFSVKEARALRRRDNAKGDEIMTTPGVPDAQAMELRRVFGLAGAKLELAVAFQALQDTTASAMSRGRAIRTALIRFDGFREAQTIAHAVAYHPELHTLQIVRDVLDMAIGMAAQKPDVFACYTWLKTTPAGERAKLANSGILPEAAATGMMDAIMAGVARPLTGTEIVEFARNKSLQIRLKTLETAAWQRGRTREKDTRNTGKVSQA